jgi:hypothetical protein
MSFAFDIIFFHFVVKPFLLVVIALFIIKYMRTLATKVSAALTKSNHMIMVVFML